MRIQTGGRVVALGFVLIVSACGSSQSHCEEPAPAWTPFCDSSLYTMVSIQTLLSRPGDSYGRMIETGGIADWYSNRSGTSDCVCAGGVCSCIQPLALRSVACGSLLRLGGSYRGRSVQCDDAGCYPLAVLQRYIVCGTWQPSTDAKLADAGVLHVADFGLAE